MIISVHGYNVFKGISLLPYLTENTDKFTRNVITGDAFTDQ